MIPIPPTTSEKLAMPTMMKLNSLFSCSADRRISKGAFDVDVRGAFFLRCRADQVLGHAAERFDLADVVRLQPDFRHLDVGRFLRAGVFGLSCDRQTPTAPTVSGK